MNFLLAALGKEFEKPEYLHVLVNPLPVYGMAMGIVALALGFLLRSRPARVVGLAVVGLAAISAWPAYELGEEGYDRVLAMSDHNGTLWLDEHVYRAKTLIALFYVLAAIAAAGVLCPLKWPRWDAPLSAATLGVAILALAAGAWIAYAGGKIRHKEFREGAPPAGKVAAEPMAGARGTK
jgi:hypothetical protein